MKVSVDLTGDQVKALDALCAAENISHAEAVLRVLTEYLDGKERAAMAAAFGLWKDHRIDGLEYQEALRSEWER